MSATLRITLAALATALLCACSSGSGDGPVLDSNSNWLTVCDLDGECVDGLSCLCGVCTAECDESASCHDLHERSACAPADDTAAVDVCGEPEATEPAPRGLCLPECDDDGDCPHEAPCVDGGRPPGAGPPPPHRRPGPGPGDRDAGLDAPADLPSDVSADLPPDTPTDAVVDSGAETDAPGDLRDADDDDGEEDASEDLDDDGRDERGDDRDTPPPPPRCPDGLTYFCGTALGLAPDTLFLCDDGHFVPAEECSGNCITVPGRDDLCAPECPDGDGMYCAETLGLPGGGLFSCWGGEVRLEVDCVFGCEDRPGATDICRETPPPP